MISETEKALEDLALWGCGAVGPVGRRHSFTRPRAALHKSTSAPRALQITRSSARWLRFGADGALRYVLLNRKHHAASQRFGRFWIDACSSAAWFTGWAEPIRADEPWKRELLALPQPTAPPETWLLASGWKRHGLLRFDERPS